jgi:hypothetical protein
MSPALWALVMHLTHQPSGACWLSWSQPPPSREPWDHLAEWLRVLISAGTDGPVEDVPFQGQAPTPLAPRVGEQLLYIAVAVWVALSAQRHAGAEVPVADHTPETVR